MDDQEYQEKIAILQLSRTRGISITNFFKLLRMYGSAVAVIKNMNYIFRENSIVPYPREKVEQEIMETKKIGATIITYKDNIYPEYLKTIDTPPLALTALGNLDLLKNKRKVAIIGSRNCSINNFNFAKKISRELASYGYIIVSGMARGIDGAAHLGALENGTIAVLGTGIDKIYPSENEYLYYQIIENSGLILSEFPLNSGPKAEHFPIRNRIIAGLSRGILIISAGPKSGTLATANLALKYNREVMVFPGNPYDDNYAGSNKLLQQGATMVISTTDIIENLETFIPYEVNDINGKESIIFNDIVHENVAGEVYDHSDSDSGSANNMDSGEDDKNSKNSENNNISGGRDVIRKNYDSSHNEDIDRDSHDNGSDNYGNGGDSGDFGDENNGSPSHGSNYVDDYGHNGLENGDNLSEEEEESENIQENMTVEDMILQKLDYVPVDINDLLDALNVPIDVANVALMKLNLDGKIIIRRGKVCKM